LLETKGSQRVLDKAQSKDIPHLLLGFLLLEERVLKFKFNGVMQPDYSPPTVVQRLLAGWHPFANIDLGSP
jgi:hypothetical protein